MNPPTPALDYLAVEVSWGSVWVNVNDAVKYRVSAEGTRDSVARSYRRVTAESPVLGGNYLIHAVPEMVSEPVTVWVHGSDQTDLADNYYQLHDLFTQFSYQIRWTTDEYREYWTCQLADSSSSRNQVWTHSLMAVSTFTVPRYPNVVRERI